jgi:ubiquinone/menaquinone biosynthesis C-methylase UbiE
MIKMKTNEHDYYSDLANWSFEDIDYTSEVFTNWVYEEEIKKHVNENSRVLDLGTAAGEKLLKNFPDCAEILGTDFSSEMIETANKNLLKSPIPLNLGDNFSIEMGFRTYNISSEDESIIDMGYFQLRPT